jgi:hypothetical protein
LLADQEFFHQLALRGSFVLTQRLTVGIRTHCRSLTAEVAAAPRTVWERLRYLQLVLATDWIRERVFTVENLSEALPHLSGGAVIRVLQALTSRSSSSAMRKLATDILERPTVREKVAGHSASAKVLSGLPGKLWPAVSALMEWNTLRRI